jgi:AcrR family transcriptional regulator
VPGGFWLDEVAPLTDRINSFPNSFMGRIAGVTAAETRERLLSAAADMFAERGYDGARVADIAVAAGLSNGALYAHFASKAELMVEALRARGRPLLAEVFDADHHRAITDLLVSGCWLPRRVNSRDHLLVEALVAAHRDEDVAKPIRAFVGDCADWLAALMRAAQTAGKLEPALSPNALTHFCLLLATGSALMTPDLPEVGDEEWATLLTRVVTSLAGTGIRPRA